LNTNYYEPTLKIYGLKDKPINHIDYLETLMNLFEENIYHNPLEKTLNNMLLFD
jgi:hypothetical protein